MNNLTQSEDPIPPSKLIKEDNMPVDKPTNYTLSILSSNYKTNKSYPKRNYRIVKNERNFYIIERLVLGLFWIGLRYNDELNLLSRFGPSEYISVKQAEESIIQFNKKFNEKHASNKREIIKEISF